MKKLMKLACAFAIIAGMTGCGKREFSVRIDENLNAVITAENASKDMLGGAGSLTVEEGQKVVVEPAIEGNGKIRIVFSGSSLSEESSPEELTNAVNAEDGDLVIEVTGSGKMEYELVPGDYFLNATVLEPTTGTVTISAK